MRGPGLLVPTRQRKLRLCVESHALRSRRRQPHRPVLSAGQLPAATCPSAHGHGCRPPNSRPRRQCSGPWGRRLHRRAPGLCSQQGTARRPELVSGGEGPASRPSSRRSEPPGRPGPPGRHRETHGSEMTPDLGTRWHLLEVVPGPGTGLLGAGAASGTAPKCRWNPGPRRTGAGLHRAPLDGRVGPPPGPESPQMQRQGSPVPLLPPQCPPRGQGPQPGEVPWMPTRPGLTRGFRRATSWAWGLLPWGCGASLGTGWGPARRPSLCPSLKLPSLLQRALLLHRK